MIAWRLAACVSIRVCVACVIAWRLAAYVSIRVCVACVIAWRLAACVSINFFEYVEHLARNVNTSETRSWFDQTFPKASSVFAATPSRRTATPSLGNRVH